MWDSFWTIFACWNSLLSAEKWFVIILQVGSVIGTVKKRVLTGLHGDDLAQGA